MAKRAYKPILPPVRTSCLAFGLLAMLAAAVAPSESVRGEIGRTTAVNPASHGTPPGRSTRVLVPRLNVFADERIETDEAGVAQILFRDGSHMSVGPNSDLVIDRFVYDPDTSAGELAASLGRGVLRFVGGQLSKRDKVTVATPVAVIGVRGGIAVIEHDIEGGTEAILLFGDEMEVRSIGDVEASTRVTRPGFSVPVGADGSIGPAAPVAPERLNRALAAVEGSPESDGGATERPNDETVRQSSYAEESVARSAVDVDPALLAPTALDETAPDRTETQAPADIQEQEPVSPAALLRYDIDFMGLDGLGGIEPITVPLAIVKPEGPFGHSFETGLTSFLSVSNSFSGEGANQAGQMHVYLGLIANFVTDPTSVFNSSGLLFGSGRDAHEGLWTTSGNFAEDPARHPNPAFDGPNPPTTFHLASGYTSFAEEFVPQDIFVIPHVSADAFERGTATARAELRQTIPLDRVVNRGPRIWHGYATGLFETRITVEGIHTPEGTYSLSNSDPMDVLVTASDFPWFISSLGARFNLSAGRTHEGEPGGLANLATNFDVTSMQVNFGRRAGQEVPTGFRYLSNNRGVYVDDSAFGALTSRVFNVGGRLGHLVYVNGRLAASVWPAQTWGWMVSNDAAPATGLLRGGVRYCDCAAARFGWWGGQIGVVAGPEGARADALFPGTFVVGNLPEVDDIPSEGTASYTGHAAAAIRNAGAAYAAVGRFEQEWDFAQRTGAVRIRSLDGRDYDARVTAPANPRDFTGSLIQTAGAGASSGDLTGSFFSNGSNPAVDVGGRFTIAEGSTYTAVGAFAATSR